MQDQGRFKKVYFNDAQQKVMYRGANTIVVVGGRRLGKSHGIVAPFVLRNNQRMPGGNHGIIANTFQQALTRTLPGTLSAWEDWGYKRNLHWIIGRKPDPKLGWPKPKVEPADYTYVLSTYTGSVNPIISQDVPGSSNSHTFDSVSIDEAKFINYEKLLNETIPANGGTKAHFGHLPWHHGMLIVSDMPTSKKGSWFLQYEEKMNPEIIAAIDGIINERYRILEKIRLLIANKETPKQYLYDYYKSLTKDLAQFQRIAVDYNVFTSIENLQVLGKGYIEQMKRDLSPLVFQTSILCRKVGILRDGFYTNLDEKVHYYTAFDNSYLLDLEYQFDKTKDLSCLQDDDLDRNAPINIAFDYNGNINWLVAGQRSGMKLKVLKSMFVKYDRRLVELVNDFCHYYRHQKCKEVIYYYDTTALGSNYAVNDKDFAATIMDTFRANKWSVRGVHIGNPMNHMEKHNLLSMALKGQQGLLPVFNRDNNEDLILGLEQTGIRQGPNGFSKDKRGEKLAETEEDKLEHRTDGTDAFDTLWIGMNNFPSDYSFNANLISSFM